MTAGQELGAIVGDLGVGLEGAVSDVSRVMRLLPMNSRAWGELAALRVRLIGLQGETNRGAFLWHGMPLSRPVLCGKDRAAGEREEVDS